jgi:hypothetical protein
LQPVAGADVKPELIRMALRGALEEQAMQVAAGAGRSPGGPGPRAAAGERDALDDLLDRAAGEAPL